MTTFYFPYSWKNAFRGEKISAIKISPILGKMHLGEIMGSYLFDLPFDGAAGAGPQVNGVEQAFFDLRTIGLPDGALSPRVRMPLCHALHKSFWQVIVLDKFRSVNPLGVFLLEAHQTDTGIFYGQHNNDIIPIF
ncbi:MAG: hypothetical protein IKS83_05490 [Victivallales bacterium]|nr:hypothetical protein [Victivallales bacterium]